MINLKQIMVATDFSQNSAPAIRYAVEFAKPFEAEVVGCHILDSTHSIIPSIIGSGEEAGLDVQASTARDTMERTLLEAGADRFRVLIEKGNPGSEIVRLARNEEIDLIVISTHGHSGIAHMLLGSTAESIVRFAPCPVMVVREGEHDFIHPLAD